MNLKKSLILTLVVALLSSNVMFAGGNGSKPDGPNKTPDGFDVNRNNRIIAGLDSRLNKLERTGAEGRIEFLETSAVMDSIDKGPRDVLLAVGKILSEVYNNDLIFYSIIAAAGFLVTKEEIRSRVFGGLKTLPGKTRDKVFYIGEVLANFARVYRHPIENKWVVMGSLFFFTQSTLGYAGRDTLLTYLKDFASPLVAKAYNGTMIAGGFIRDWTAVKLVDNFERIPLVGRIVPRRVVVETEE